MQGKVGLDLVRNALARGERVLQAVEAESRKPNDKKVLQRLWSRKEVAADVGQHHSTIANKIKTLIDKGLVPDFTEGQISEGGQVSGYRLDQLNAFRAVCNTLPKRALGEEPQIIAVQSFKGGVGKTVTAVLLAQYLASQGYRVCFADLDSQGSGTTTFGYIPDLHIDEDETLLPYFRGEQGSIDYAIKKTYWPNLDLIPANLQIYNLELEMGAKIGQMTSREEKLNAFFTLRRGIDSIKNNYDIVIIDSPPALGMISMNILCAADSFVVPTPPQLYDFSSTLQFFRLIESVLEGIAPDKEYSFMKILATKVQKNYKADKTFLGYMRAAFGDGVLAAEVPMLSEIANAAMTFGTILEDRRPKPKPLAAIEYACGMIEQEILNQWPSMHGRSERLELKMNEHKKKLGLENE